jgi:subtilisin family serine protease
MRSLLVLLAACSAPTGSTTQPAKTPIVDSHVHLAYDPVGDQLAAHGVGAVVDLAAPERTLATTYPLRVIRSGPMLTRPGGYPLDAWGADGYGIGCDTAGCVTEVIDRLIDHGAGVIKIALDDDGLPPALLDTAVARAHARGVKVAVHALTDASARLAAEHDVDVLAHTPVEPLAAETITAWQRAAANRERAVISTLAAFGGSPAAVDNLRRLRAAGVTVLYGTDLGNLRVDGPSTEEVALLRRAGLSEADVTAAMTTVPWRFWRFDSR